MDWANSRNRAAVIERKADAAPLDSYAFALLTRCP
jgi:hypothetical protein